MYQMSYFSSYKTEIFFNVISVFWYPALGKKLDDVDDSDDNHDDSNMTKTTMEEKQQVFSYFNDLILHWKTWFPC